MQGVCQDLRHSCSSAGLPMNPTLSWLHVRHGYQFLEEKKRILVRGFVILVRFMRVKFTVEWNLFSARWRRPVYHKVLRRQRSFSFINWEVIILILKCFQFAYHNWLCERIHLINIVIGTNCMNRTLAFISSMSHGTWPIMILWLWFI